MENSDDFVYIVRNTTPMEFMLLAGYSPVTSLWTTNQAIASRYLVSDAEKIIYRFRTSGDGLIYKTMVRANPFL